MKPFFFRTLALRGLLFLGVAGVLLPSAIFAAEGVKWTVYGGNETGAGNRWIHQNILERMAKEKPAVVLHTGNLVSEGDRKNQWEQFSAETRPSQFSFRPAVGVSDRSKTDRFIK